MSARQSLGGALGDGKWAFEKGVADIVDACFRNAINLAIDQHPLGGNANLACVDEAADRRCIRHGLQIRIPQHHQRSIRPKVCTS
jgi:hypothetical protein